MSRASITRSVLTLTSLCAIVGAPDLCQAQGSSGAQTLPRPEGPRLEGPSRGGVYESVLPNGMKVLMKEVHTAPLMCVSVWYKAGSAHESNGTTGLAHLLEHMMFKGTEKYGKGVYDRMLEANGAVNNASTWLDRTQYFILIAADKTDLALELEADRMRNALFTQQDLDDEMPVVRNEMEKGEDNPYGELDDRIQAMSYLEHPYHWTTIGWKSDVESITAEQIHAYYDKYYWPNNGFLVLVGDLPAKEMLAKAVKHFGALPTGGETPQIVTVEPEQKGERRFLIREAGQNRILGIGYRSVARADGESYALDLLGRVLGQGETSRLYRGLVEAGFAVDAYAGNRSWFRDPYLFQIFVTLSESADADSAEAAVYAEIEKLAQTPPTRVELDRAIKQAQVETYFERDDITSVMYAIGEAEIAESYHFYETYLDSLAAVTPEEVQRAAATYLHANARTVGFYLPDGQEGGSWTRHDDKRSSRYPDGRAWRRDPELLPDGTPAEGAAGAPALPLTPSAGGAPGSAGPRMKTEIQSSKVGVEAKSAALPSRSVLANGIVLLVQESHENPTVAIEARLNGGLLTEPAGKEGVAELCALTLTKGTRRHSAAELAELLESNGISLSFSPAADHVKLSARSLAADFPLMVEIIGEVLNEATFPADQIEIARNQMVTSLNDQLQDTGAMSMRTALEAVYGKNSPYARFTEGSEETLGGLSAADLEAYRQGLLQGNRWSFAVVGDVQTAKAKSMIEKALKSVPAGSALAVIPPAWNAPAGGPLQVDLADKSQTDLVYLGPGIAPNDPQRSAVYLANVILGGSFTSRLNGELRDNQGLTYGAGSRFVDRMGVNYWFASLGVNPENVEKGLVGVKAELEKIQNPGVTEDELNRAKEYAAGSFPIRLQSKDAVADLLLYADTWGLGLDYTATFGAKLRAVTLAEVQAAVNRFTDSSKMVVVSAGTFSQP